MKKKSSVIIIICCILLIVPGYLSARNNEWAEFFKNKHILSYAIQDSIHWIGTGLGLFKYNSKSDSTQRLSHITNIDNGVINDIAVSKNGSVWFVINKTSLFYLNEENWTQYSSLNCGLPKGDITKITTDDFNNLWLIVENRLMKFNGKDWLCYPKIRDEHCSNFMFFDILINNDIIWVHTNEGIAAYHNYKWQEYKLGRGYKVNSSWNFVKGKDNCLFILYYDKIQAIIKDSLITFEPLEIGVNVEGITAFKLEDNGEIYIARNSGEDNKYLDFLMIKDNKILHLESINNDYDYIQQIEEDKQGNIFIITTKYLYKLEKENLKLVWSRNNNIPFSELNETGEYKDIAEIKRFSAKGKGVIINNQEKGYWTYANSNNQIIMDGAFEKGKKVGTWKTYLENGSIDKIIQYKNGFKDGYYVEHYENGNKKNKMSYSHGILEGKWISWHENGVVKIVGEYKNNLKEGVWLRHYANGKIYEEGRYKNNNKVGLWLKYDTENKLQEKGEYKNNNKNGIWCRYFISGCYGEIEYENGVEISDWKYWNSEEFPIYSKYYPKIIKQPNKLNEKGNKQGSWITFMWSNFKQCNSFEGATYYRIAEYDDGVPQGIVCDYYKDGTLQFEGKLISEFPSVYAGKIRIYNHGKLKKERTYFDKEKNGLEEIWDNDVLISKGYYENGIKIGYWIETTGSKMYEGEYINGKREYLWKIYSKEEHIEGKYYRHGKFLEPINLKEVYPSNLLKIVEYNKAEPIIVNPIFAEDWFLKLSLKSLISKIESKKKASPVLSSESANWPIGKTSTIGREAMYMLQGFIDGRYPPTECSVIDFDPDPEYYRKWWDEYNK